jgi:hypothetical protein
MVRNMTAGREEEKELVQKFNGDYFGKKWLEN